jgi:hypothetical protein
MIAIAVAQVAADREQLIAKGYIDMLAAAVMRRSIMDAEAEIRWHDELDAALAEASGDTRAPIRGGSALALGEGSFDIAAGEAGGVFPGGVGPVRGEPVRGEPDGAALNSGEPARLDRGNADRVNAERDGAE